MAIKIDIQLEVQQLTSTSAMIKWRFFASHEKQYIDGAQIRYKIKINIDNHYQNYYWYKQIRSTHNVKTYSHFNFADTLSFKTVVPPLVFLERLHLFIEIQISFY